MKLLINKNRLLAAASFFVLLFAAAGCSDTAEVEQPEFAVSETDLAFEQSAGEKIVTVETNLADWMPSSPAEGSWLSLEKSAGKLVVKAKENVTGEIRKTYIILNASRAVKKITVSQAAATATLGIEGGEVLLPQKGGDVTAYITSNLSGYEIKKTETADWLTVIPKKHSVKFVAPVNRSTNDRVAKLALVGSGKTAEVIVRQPGISLFILACNPGTPFDIYKMMDFEHRRGSILAEYAAPDASFDLTEESFYFHTTSPLFKDIYYVHDTRTGVATRVFTRSFTDEGIKAVRSPEFKAYLAERGYVRSEQDTNIYVSELEKQAMRIDILESNHSVVLFFNQVRTQQQDYPTFETLDLGPLELLNNDSKKSSDVEAWENSQGSSLMAKHTNENGEIEALSFNTNRNPLINRSYFFYSKSNSPQISNSKIGSVEQYTLNFDTPTLGVWQNGNNWDITRQFDSLLKANGFVFIESSGKFHVYGRKSDKLVLAIKGDKFSDINNNKPVLQIGVLYKPSLFSQNSSEARRALHECLLKMKNNR